MRFLKIVLIGILAAFALITGVFVTVALAAGSALRLMMGRRSTRTATAHGGFSSPRRSAHASAADIIDVTATEIPATQLEK